MSAERAAQRLGATLDARGERILVSYNLWDAGWAVDPVTKDRQGRFTYCVESIRGFIHSPNYADAKVSHFTGWSTEVKILDTSGGRLDKVLDAAGRQRDEVTDLEFTIAGIGYVQRHLNEELQAAWDASFGGVQMAQTLILERKK
jgi:hypothetical protein